MERNKFNFSVSLRFRVTTIDHNSVSKIFTSVNESFPHKLFIFFLFSHYENVKRNFKQIAVTLL